MASALRRFWARLTLLLLLVRHLAKRTLFFWKKKPGLATFIKQYSADAIFPVTEAERSHFPVSQKCQACSLCTLSCAALREGRAASSFEPKFIMLGYSRSSHESEFFLEDWLPCLGCDACTVECPNEVPVHAVAQQIIDRRNRIGFRQGAD